MAARMGHKSIDVPFAGTMALGHNFIMLGGTGSSHRPRAARGIGRLKALGHEVAAVDMSEISKTGGIHGMGQALRGVPA